MNHLLQPIVLFADQGGPVIWAILAVCFLLWLLIVQRYYFIYRIYPRLRDSYLNLWQQRSEHTSWRAHKIRQAWISQAHAQLSRFVATIKTLIAICPLLGLLGTVTGMVGVFEVIAVEGNSEAQAMAAGIFRATIPTMAGLVVALSGLYFSTQLQKHVQDSTQHLADQLTPDLNLQATSHT